jgi:hypothetical protein
MLLNRLPITLLAAAALLMPLLNTFAAEPGLSAGEWQFTRKDNAGVTWTGTLKIEKVDGDRSDPNKYDFQCDIDTKSPKSSWGLSGPCSYDSAARKLTLGGKRMDSYSYIAVLAPDGKALVKGEFSETADELKNETWVKVKITGEWSAKRK